jgi:hypothetical protein
MLSHLIYWCDRGCNKDGFIWKSYREWTEETGLNRYQVDKAADWLKNQGFVEIKKRMARGHPTLHYKLNQIELLDAVDSICRNEQMKVMKPTNDICRNEQIHNRDFSTETSSETLKRKKGGEAKNSSPLSLAAFLKEAKKRGDQVESEATRVIQHFLKRHEHYRKEKHPRLRYEQWKEIASSILSTGADDDHHNLTLAHHEAMSEKYFNDRFNDGDCDYRLSHYNAGFIKLNKMHEVAY